MFIKYYMSGGHMYARLLEAKRDENGARYDVLHCHLGRVIDEEKGFFKSRDRGAFKYSLGEGFCDIDDTDAQTTLTHEPKTKSMLILDFGPEYVFAEALKKEGIWDIFMSIAPKKADTLMTLILHNMLWTEACQYAEDFWRTSYASIAFPNAKLKSQRISEFLEELGDEAVYREFFDAYLKYTVSKSGTSRHSIIVDSTGLPNDCRMDLTAVNVHRGAQSNEVRLIFAVDRATGFPLYFRYVKGSILDVNSLQNTIAGLKHYGIDVDHCLVDAGYYCGDNIESLNALNIPYLLRLRAGNNIYDGLLEKYIDGLDAHENRVLYGNRVVFIKCVPIEFHSGQAFAYVAIDYDVQSDERRRIYMKNQGEFASKAEMDVKLKNAGAFILVSKIEVGVNEILPLYYSRQTIEQAFDFEKNYANLLPLRKHGEKTFRGHILISFMSAVSIMIINRLFINAHPRAKNKKPFSFIQARSCLRQMKCQVYDDQVLVAEPDRKSNEILKALKVGYARAISR